MRFPFRGQRSQAMPEFALVAPVLLLILFGIFDFGRGIIAYVTIQHAANEGGRVLSEGYPPGGTGSAFAAQSTSSITTAAIKDSAALKLVAQGTACSNGPIPSLAALQGQIAANQGWVFVTDPEPESTWGSQSVSGFPATQGNAPQGDSAAAGTKNCYPVQPSSGVLPLQVTVVYHFSPITPLIGKIIGSNVMLYAYSDYETEY